MVSSEQWKVLAQAYAFLGNSLLAPMTQTENVGLDPAFWEGFPSFDDADVRAAEDGMARRVRDLVGEDDPVLKVSVEYTHLFIGPPRPAAAPWETFYRGGEAASGSVVGFGEATFAMRQQLRELGLELRNENNQYEDHLGIELLCLSELCSRASREEAEAAAVAAFIKERPLNWIDAFSARVMEECPDGYFAGLSAVAVALLRWHFDELSR